MILGKYNKTKLIVLSLTFIFTSILFTPLVMGISIYNERPDIAVSLFDGYILYTPEYSKETYIIDKNGDIVHSWESNNIQAFGVYLLDNGEMLRSSMPYINPTFLGGGVTGGVEKFDWNGNLVWSFEYSNNKHCLHHDIEPLPNGNVLMIAWEHKTAQQAIQAGRDPDLLPSNQLWPDYIIEVKPTGPRSSEIVWEWHVWDHLIQDFDPTKDNYGVVEDHPELIDVNFGYLPILGDWNHVNSIDYNEELDQILLSSRHLNEIWIIDHSTTTEEAASHTGGISGKGGDILYRWGNPKSYRAGTAEDQIFFAQHDANWIEEGNPGEGHILVFNNGNGRPGTYYSEVNEIIPPVDGNGNYYLGPGSSFNPVAPTWTYTADTPQDFYAGHLSSAQRLSDGNTLICNGPEGKFFEITSENEVIWQYQNPYPNMLQNDVFKIQFISVDVLPPEEPDLHCDGSINWANVNSGEVIYDNFLIENIGYPDSPLYWDIESYPDWGTWSFEPENGEGLKPEDGQIKVNVTIYLPDTDNKDFEGSLRVVNQENTADFDIIPVHITTSITRNYEDFVHLQSLNRLGHKLFDFFRYILKYLY